MMGRKSKWEYLKAIYERYHQAERVLRRQILQPSVKLVKKVRLGFRIKRLYDVPKTPFQRVCESAQADRVKVAQLKNLFESLDPFLLSKTIEQKLDRIYKRAHHRKSSAVFSSENKASNNERTNMKTRSASP